MTKLISIDEKIPVHIDDIIVHLSPLTYGEKMDLQAYMSEAIKGDMVKAMKGASLAIKYAVKGIEGVTDSTGNPFTLEFEENKRHLTDKCVDNLLNLPQNNKMVLSCTALLEGIPTESLVNPLTGEALEGVSFGSVEGKQLPKKVSGD